MDEYFIKNSENIPKNAKKYSIKKVCKVLKCDLKFAKLHRDIIK